MQKSDFYYELPDALIAQAPLAERSAARMLIVDGRQGTWQDARICDLPDLLQPGDLLVLNDTRVLPARLPARKATGGAVELLLDRLVDAREGWFLAKSSKALRPGMRLHLPGGAVATVEEKDGMEVRLSLSADAQWLPILEAEGSMPLPPYIRRAPEASDRERYQTIYAAHPGAVAAPTAGLHFDAQLLDALAARGVERTFVTLHVGAGTFLPVRSDDITEHPMHAETMEVSATTVAAVAAAKARGKRVIAVGTTACRALETAAQDGTLRPYTGETRLFIYPGKTFQVIDGLLTNFHLPESTLLMLVCAFAGMECMLAAYRHAVAEGYRFFSYGDAMLISPQVGQR
ncbi:S-adenosylmethionine:tRNA ribosyltransferase-isomerase [Acidithiobacillus ferrivorans SS3]|jgi:S-adenosylmethionine:tRNA ribosyltransferase-isomerase|uniref:S-adenosylmethionine:tRNA ribosyltransferase-isomerase n=2 Tax=Acidithiobacillus ferrivorans TaxID=160808 RepID=A0A1B9BXA8_9PROT|nr:tRNA preQ1(34) S-adenosylmethionine ribosyltransferase-isomerase QueA [Acidithiobacillus ferrivorans]AEM48303.1 S-adenosylmethionine:tRNA ribosyltransferase-isomerase [Acidithiobacillus ferrivorans SS3]MBU2765183.1 tRNA preQ1(34) S-adenosylmethionine ribosyltransferase-isomerase QueA [Acidithiobacillus ferrivorans]MBU2850015.1 tRNA preQ1(34) S-adenosylmethionine ribosyltransferase-isomerase QueA [Acidithiobacillus ferrivorans]OCB02293.1 tRNA preQ1(34) S-adenosylmethionine ribosyltransferase-